MYGIYIALIIVISIIALLGTIYAGRQSNNDEGQSVNSDLSPSVKYDRKRSSIKLLSIIYGITFLITIVIIVIILF